MICIDDEGSTRADEPKLVLLIRFYQPYLKPARAFYFKDLLLISRLIKSPILYII